MSVNMYFKDHFRDRTYMQRWSKLIGMLQFRIRIYDNLCWHALFVMMTRCAYTRQKFSQPEK